MSAEELKRRRMNQKEGKYLVTTQQILRFHIELDVSTWNFLLKHSKLRHKKNLIWQ